MTKKLLFATRKSLAPIGEGGGETIAHDLLKALNEKEGILPRALGSFTYPQLPVLAGVLKELGIPLQAAQQVQEIETAGGKFAFPSFAHMEYQLEGSYTTTLARDDHYFVSMNEFLKQLDPELVLLQAEASFETASQLLAMQKRVLLYVQNGFEADPFKQRKAPTPELLSNSEFTAKQLKERLGYDSKVLYPAVDIDRYISDEPRPEFEKLTALYINPIAVKGLQAFLHMVDAVPEMNFVVIEGWGPMDPRLFQVLKDKPNVQCLNKTWNMKEVYRRADMLIAPSQWNEAFGRVVVEAHAAGMPTLASRVGGLPEASGDAGLLVDDFKNPQAWSQTLKDLVANPGKLDEKRPLLAENAKRFTPDKAADRFQEIVG